MKNLFRSSLALLAFFGLMVLSSSYVGRPLFGTATNQDNTGRSLTYGAFTINDTVGSDTILIVPSNYDKYYTINIQDSAFICIKSTGSSFTYSHLHFIINAGAGSARAVNFIGYSGLATQWLPTTTGTSRFALTASHTAQIEFVCTGTAFAECYRSQN